MLKKLSVLALISFLALGALVPVTKAGDLADKDGNIHLTSARHVTHDGRGVYVVIAVERLFLIRNPGTTVGVRYRLNSADWLDFDVEAALGTDPMKPELFIGFIPLEIGADTAISIRAYADIVHPDSTRDRYLGGRTFTLNAANKWQCRDTL